MVDRALGNVRRLVTITTIPGTSQGPKRKTGRYPAPYPSFPQKRRGRCARYLDGRAPQIVGRNSEAYSAKSLSPPRHQDTKLLISSWCLSVLVVQLSCFLEGKARHPPTRRDRRASPRCPGGHSEGTGAPLRHRRRPLP